MTTIGCPPSSRDVPERGHGARTPASEERRNPRPRRHHGPNRDGSGRPSRGTRFAMVAGGTAPGTRDLRPMRESSRRSRVTLPAANVRSEIVMRTSSTPSGSTRRGSWIASALTIGGAVAIGVRASADDRPIPPAPPPPPSPLGAPEEPPILLGDSPTAPVQPPAGAPNNAPRFSREQLLQLVGPVALYPDPVLASLLPATTFPMEVVAAARWVRENGPEAKPSPETLQAWDMSVQGLVQFPDVLLWLDQNLPWLEQMGTAVANQQAEVLNAIQEFRRKAKEDRKSTRLN